MFREALPNKTTRQKYERRLIQFFEFIEMKGDLDEQSKKFVESSQKDLKWIVSMIMKYMRFHKEITENKDISIATLPNYYKPIKLFCEMNDLVINWKKKLQEHFQQEKQNQLIEFQ